MLINPPLSLYIHVPWCVRKCPYCDFNSHAIKNVKSDQQTEFELPETEYIDRLLFDLEQELPQVWGRRLHSIFIGGGTPSVLSPESYDRLISGIRARLPFEGDIEITMEANPGTFEAEKFRGFREAGINRLSIGVQSFNADHLRQLGRIHNPQQAIEAASFAHEAGFDSFNLDLMHGLPDQSVEQALNDLKQALELKPHHISWYQLTLEPNTLFYQQPPQLPHDEILWDIQEAGQALLAKHGYEQYETSAYARSAPLRAKHNLNYWQFGDYLGIGAGAHGKITRLDLGQIHRTTKKRHPKDYLQLNWNQVSQQTTIPAHELPFEFMLNALRLIDGVPIKLFSQRTGISMNLVEPIIRQAIEDGLLEDSSLYLKPTQKGALFLNELLQRFIPEEHSKPDDSGTIQVTQL
ncbi:radical SAM family heme chaperone HemW [Kangiella sediminilitoris]|uniref:Heme chaperone HemW n=1 Tax=Kangiella sediminilitoris TaxID=1144748 RepID=A0A1B3BDN0_9GAMM|nr:Oxygen-independent coproporphyrinogen III oxidase [Kangiella sediminilitoris]